MTYHTPGRPKPGRTSALLLLAAALSFSSCNQVFFKDSVAATNRVKAELAEAQSITGRLLQASLVSGEEAGRLTDTLKGAEVINARLAGKLQSALERHLPEDDKTLLDDFVGVAQQVNTFELQVSTLGNARAREGFQTVLTLINGDLLVTAEALACKNIERCMRCSDEHIYCKA
ncbi:MAG TPA: hypothetical protein VF659_13715 [Pyrinomonadaceae bacterium]|jgi:hypothetical protein